MCVLSWRIPPPFFYTGEISFPAYADSEAPLPPPQDKRESPSLLLKSVKSHPVLHNGPFACSSLALSTAQVGSSSRVGGGWVS